MSYDKILTNAEIETLNQVLGSIEGGRIHNVEALDGFFAALACGPDCVLPSEYMEVIQSGKAEDGDLVLSNNVAVRTFVELISRHWNHVVHQLREGPVYLPLLLEDDGAQAFGNDWAKAFLTGTELRHTIWDELIQDDNLNGPMVPIWVLAYETHEDPELRPFSVPLKPKTREALHLEMAASTMRLYRHFVTKRAKSH